MIVKGFKDIKQARSTNSCRKMSKVLVAIDTELVKREIKELKEWKAAELSFLEQSGSESDENSVMKK